MYDFAASQNIGYPQVLDIDQHTSDQVSRPGHLINEAIRQTIVGSLQGRRPAGHHPAPGALHQLVTTPLYNDEGQLLRRVIPHDGAHLVLQKL